MIQTTMTRCPKKIIYDLGANNGDDIPYYLKKADAVVAIEANPSLCHHMEKRFFSEIEHNRLIVENRVITTDDSENEVFFYIHKHNHVLSQFPKPDETTADAFERVRVQAQSILKLIQKYGDPYYIKIDIEHYDEAILRALFQHDIRPPFISAESHSIEVFSLLVSLGRYNAFKLVDGPSVPQKYKHAPITLEGRREWYSFPHHSAGPFGEDIAGDWMTANNFFRLLAYENLGWKDIHATNQVPPNLSAVPRMETYIKRKVIKRLNSLIPKPLRNKGIKLQSP
jgi:FkbM family methyltransferase